MLPKYQNPSVSNVLKSLAIKSNKIKAENGDSSQNDIIDDSPICLFCRLFKKKKARRYLCL